MRNVCLYNDVNEESLSENKKIAVFSTTLGDNYFFFTPITALIWKSFIHYLPFAIVVVPQTISDNDLVNFEISNHRSFSLF